MEEPLPSLEDLDRGPTKHSTHSTVAVSTDDEFDHVTALDDDIEVAAEQVVDEWSERLKGSDVYGEDDEADEEVQANAEMVGTMNEALPAGGYDEVVMGYDEGNVENDQEYGGGGSENEEDAEEEEEMFEEEVVEDSFSEEIIDDTEMLMDDGEIEEILSQAANIVEDNDSDDAAAIQNEAEGSVQDPSEESQSSAFQTGNELLSNPPEAPQRQISDGNDDDDDENPSGFLSSEVAEDIESGEEDRDRSSTADVEQDDDDALEKDVEGSVDTPVVQEDIVNVYETKQYARPEDTAGFGGGANDNEEEEEKDEKDEKVANLGQNKIYETQQNDDIESGMTVAPDIPESVQMNNQKNSDDDIDDDEDGFLCCILVVACLCFVLVILSIVLPLVFLRKRGDGPTLSPTRVPTRSPATASPTPTPVGTTPAPSSLLLAWTQNVSSIFGSENSGFGSALALDANFYVVGAPQHDATGAVFTAYFEGGWNLAIDPLLVGETEGEDFGAALDILDGQLIVGAPSRIIDNTLTPAGVAYFYVFDDELKIWTKVGETLQTNEGLLEANGEFGSAVAISNNGNVPRVAVGAPRISRSVDELQTGRVYTYEISPTSTVSLDEDEPLFGKEPFDLFGSAVDLTSDGQRLVVGAPGEASSSGYVHIFQLKNGAWDLELEIPGSQGERFGASVVCLSNSDDVYAIGAPDYRAKRGRVVVYRRVQSGRYEQLGPDIIGAEGDMFGTTGSVNGGLDENGDILLIVAGSSGVVKTFRHESSDNSWIQHALEVQTGHDKVQVEYSEEDGLLITDPDEDKATLFGPDGSVVSTSVEKITGPVPAPLNGSPNALPSSPQNKPSDSSVLSNWVLSTNEFSPVRESSEFGVSVSMTASLMAIGAPGTSDSGAVLIYEKVNGDWVGAASAEITGTVIGGRFGAAVDTTGRFLVVGAPNTILPGSDTEIGAAYCYISTNGEWEQFGETLRGDTGVFGADEEFGFAVGAGNNGRIVVGAPSSSVELLSKRGRFYVFEYSTTASAWSRILDVEGLAAGDGLGYSVAMSNKGDRFVVGAPGGNYAYLYAYDGVDWTIKSALEGISGEAFGSSVCFLSSIGDLMAIGSPMFNGGRGRIVVYQESSNGTWVQLGQAIVGEDGEAIGTTVAGDSLTPTVLVGTSPGRVKKFVYSQSQNEWSLESAVDSGFAGGVAALDVSNESSELAAGSAGNLAVYEQQ